MSRLFAILPFANFFVLSAFVGGGVHFWGAGQYLGLIGCWAGVALLGHAMLMAFHESGHKLLPVFNEAQGIVYSLFTWVPLSAYRIVHVRSHHGRFGSEDDCELFPYVNTAYPRWARILAVIFGFFFGLFRGIATSTRSVILSWARISPRLRTRLVIEYALIVVFWGLVFTTLTYGGWLLDWFAAYFVPALFSGSAHASRELVEHLGLYGEKSDPSSLTRTVVPRNIAERFLCAVNLLECVHGVHHIDGRIPADELLKHKDLVTDNVYPSYWAAIKDMLPHLRDPRIGKQWLSG